MQPPVENYILYRILIGFVLMKILFNITKRLSCSKNFPHPRGKNNP